MGSATGTVRNEAEQARDDWERRIYRRLTDADGGGTLRPGSELAPPGSLRATPGAGHVRLDWSAVPGAAGYVIERTDPDGQPRVLLHGGADVAAVPAIHFADTGLTDGVVYRYRVAAVLGNDFPAGQWSVQVSAGPSGSLAGPVHVRVAADRVAGRKRPLWHMIGSERLSQLRFGDDGHGHDIGREFTEALRIARTDLGVTHVRAHAILHDDNAVVSRGPDGALAFNFTVVDDLYDQLRALDLRPVVELSFMPAVLAREPGETVFAYRGIISPPRDWAEWRATVKALTTHLVDRYGRDEVRRWGFEVWNEPNLEVFWSGSRDEYFRLYLEAAQAIREVDAGLPVGGPSTAAAEWVPALAEFAAERGLPLDFASTHTYGNLPLTFRSALRDSGFADAEIYWTEWGVGSTHYGPIHDGVSGAPFALAGFKDSQDRVDRLAYWVISDHFEELGRPPALFHNGFGLLTVGNLRKPRYWAVLLAQQLGPELLDVHLDGDGAHVLVDAWAGRHEDGTVDVLVFNGTINAAVMNGDPRLDREVAVRIDGLAAPSYRAELARVDRTHSNVLAGYPDGLDWPDAERLAAMREADRLDTQAVPVEFSGASATLRLTVPQPGVARIRLVPGGRS